MPYLDDFNSNKQNIDTIVEDISQDLQSDKIDGTPELEELKVKFAVIGPYIDNTLNKIPPELITINSLNSLTTHLQFIKNQINNGIINNTPLNFREILRRLDDTINLLGQLPNVTKSDLKTSLNIIRYNYEKEMKKTITKLDNEKTAFTSSLESSQEKLDALDNKIAEKNNEVSTITTNFQQQFANAQEKRTTDFHDSIQKLEEDNNTIKQKAEEETKKIIDSMRHGEEESKKLLQIVGSNAYAGNYTIYANKAKNFANWLF